METNPRKAWINVALSFLLVMIPACSTYQARQAIEARQKEFYLNTEAWQVARLRLKAMCPIPMQATQALTDALYETYRAMDKKIDPDIHIMVQAMRDIGEGKLNIDVFKEKLEGQVATGGDRSCNLRFVKVTNAPVSNDWQWDWLPSYGTIVSVHEEELRKRVTPKLYEEYMLGLSRFLAKSTDNGNITPKELVETFNAGWSYMVAQMKNEATLLVYDLKAAQLSDAQTWKTIGEIAGGLAAVATATLVASAAASAARETYVSPPSYVGPLTTPGPYNPPLNLGQPTLSRSRRAIHCEARQPAYTIYIDCY